jgi:hypothetical protein
MKHLLYKSGAILVTIHLSSIKGIAQGIDIRNAQ